MEIISLANARLNPTSRETFSLLAIANPMDRSSAFLSPLNTVHVQLGSRFRSMGDKSASAASDPARTWPARPEQEKYTLKSNPLAINKYEHT
jgi:hypothetical protein